MSRKDPYEGWPYVSMDPISRVLNLIAVLACAAIAVMIFWRFA